MTNIRYSILVFCSLTLLETPDIMPISNALRYREHKAPAWKTSQLSSCSLPPTSAVHEELPLFRVQLTPNNTDFRSSLAHLFTSGLFAVAAAVFRRVTIKMIHRMPSKCSIYERREIGAASTVLDGNTLIL